MIPSGGHFSLLGGGGEGGPGIICTGTFLEDAKFLLIFRLQSVQLKATIHRAR